MEKSKLTKIIVLASGGAFLASSVMGLSSLIGSSIDRPTATENTIQSQSAQLQAEEKGFATVLQREPNNQTALRGLVEIRMQRGDVAGTRDALAQLVKLNPKDPQYKEFLAVIDKQIADSKKVGTLKPTEPTQPTQPSKSK
ncbi:tetratricopeptide repeat protein [Chamaesiphon sp. GL140_3_metabinner_50]|uniref:tetratricopeptide repeat protein n=1 Tax=Chamaesiphon sp. GL140_3_metabinner_50 TaxID=2970812 RepID=UPI0025F10FB5|nr:tetratricopeptide repeat protein [Chamaesiphon sp. GL140_3_metabinner_50]